MSDIKTCPTCTYAYRGEICDNPGCRTGSCATPENVARWDAEAARLKAEREEREWLSRVRSSCYEVAR